MNDMFEKIGKWSRQEDGTAAAEFALVFPVLFMMILGIWDVGNAILVNQKAIAAGQIVIDLIGREEVVSDQELADAFQAGQLAMLPFPTAGLVLEVASVSYDDANDPQMEWQESSDGSCDTTLPAKAIGLGTTGDAALAVQVTYRYEPSFSGQVIGTINMRERIFSRGRRGSLITKDVSGC